MEVLSKILAEFFAESFWTVRSKSLLIGFFKFWLKIFHVGDLGFEFVNQEFLNGKDFIGTFDLFGFEIGAAIIEKFLVGGDLSFGNLISLEKFFKIILYVAGFLVFLTFVELSTKQVLNLALVELFLLNVVFPEFEILFMNGLIFVGINDKLDTGVKWFEHFIKGRNISFLDLD